MQIRITEDVFELFPSLEVVVLVVRGVDNLTEQPRIAELLRQEEEIARELFAVQPLAEHPQILCWRKAYSAFDAKKYRASVEALARRVIKGDQIPSINPLVDLYNLTSLKYLVPVGGEDIRGFKGDVTLRRATGEESFIPLGTTEEDPPKPGEVVYVDDEDHVLCRRFNWRESDVTKITEETVDALLYIEALPPCGEVELKEAAYFLGEHVKEFTGAAVESYSLKASYPIVTI